MGRRKELDYSGMIWGGNFVDLEIPFLFFSYQFTGSGSSFFQKNGLGGEDVLHDACGVFIHGMNAGMDERTSMGYQSAQV